MVKAIYRDLQGEEKVICSKLDDGDKISNGEEENQIEAVKLSDYGLGHMTNYGLHVSFPVFVNPRTTPPEVFSHTTDLPQDRSGQ